MNFHIWNGGDSELQGAIPISHPQVPFHALSCLHLPQVRLCTPVKNLYFYTSPFSEMHVLPCASVIMVGIKSPGTTGRGEMGTAPFRAGVAEPCVELLTGGTSLTC